MEKENRNFDKFNRDTHFKKMKFSDLNGNFNNSSKGGIDFIDFDKNWDREDEDHFLD